MQFKDDFKLLYTLINDDGNAIAISKVFEKTACVRILVENFRNKDLTATIFIVRQEIENQRKLVEVMKHQEAIRQAEFQEKKRKHYQLCSTIPPKARLETMSVPEVKEIASTLGLRWCASKKNMINVIENFRFDSFPLFDRDKLNALGGKNE